MGKGAPCWMGLITDHLIEDCPHRVRSRAQLERYGWWKRCITLVDPDAHLLCGWCRRVWKARNWAPETAQQSRDGHLPGAGE